jgi:hypothetical protein
MRSKYIIKTYKIDDFKTLSILDTDSNTLTKFIAVPIDDQLDFISIHELEPFVKAMGEIDGTESKSKLGSFIPHVYVRDSKSMSNVKVRSYACCSIKEWTDRPIHYDAHSSFNCILEKLMYPEGLIITVEDV